MSQLIYFAITIGILVFIHEFGHFAAAKLCKMRADIFAIGFGQRLFGFNKINGFTFGSLPKDFDGQGHTDYRLNLVPLGGYVKIAGMVDESFDTSFANKEPEPYEFRAKPTLQKAFVITAGVLMNLLLALLVFWGGNFFQGKQYKKTTTVGYIAPQSAAQKAGFVEKDKILSVNGKEVVYWEELNNEIEKSSKASSVNFTVLRGSQKVDLNVKTSLIPSEKSQEEFLLPAEVKPGITDVAGRSPAKKAGIQAGDILLELNNVPLVDVIQTTQLISSHKNVTMPIKLLRNGKDTVSFKITPGPDGKIGIVLADLFTGPTELHTFGFFESFYYGSVDIYHVTVMTFTMFKKVITGNIQFSQAFGGPIKIAQYAAKFADSGFVSFLSFLAMLSLSLAIINILPIPALDGGHFVIIIIEGIIKREIPLKLKIAIQNTGFVLLLILMAFIIYNDILSM